MGQDVVNSEIAAEGLADPEPPAQSKPVEYSYTREKLLSFADLESCKKRPESLDPVVWRDAPAADGTEAGIAIPAISRGLVRREREGEAFSKSPVDIPEWRKDSWRSGGNGVPLPPGSRRKPYDEEPPGNAFSTSYPPRPAGNWGDNGHSRNSYERSGLQGQGSGRWEHRAGFPDREREQGRIFQKWDGEEIVSVWPPDALRTEGLRPFGSTAPVVRPGWLPAERDGLLGSGGGLHRTYTGNFTTPSALRASLERQMSMGPPERQMSMGLPERQMGPLERQMSMGPPERQMGMGMGPPERQMSLVPPERQMSMVPPERQMSMVPPERQMSMVPLERQMSIVPPERQMSMVPPERQMSIVPPERQMSMGPPPERPISMGPPERQMSMGPPERQMNMGPPERQMSMGPPERQMSMGPPERQMSMGPPERQMSMGRMVPRHSDPYHASRSLKGPAFVRREDTDFINDETFGSEESSTDDRAEQERKRRESFELMRKDHHRLLQKQQKLITQKHEERLANPESNTNRKHDESSLWDSTPAVGMPSSPPHSPEKKSLGSEEVTSGSVVLTPVVAPSTPRPAIPPGFGAKILQQMQTTVKAPSTNGSLEEHNIETKDNLKQTGMQSEATALLQEKVGRDEPGKAADKTVPTSADRSEGAGASANLTHSEPAIVVPPLTTEAQDNMSQQKRSDPKAGEEEGEEWSLRSKGIADKKKEAMSTDDVKEDIFVAVDEYHKSEESLLDKWFGRSSDKGSVGVLPSHPLEDELQNRIPKEDGWSDIDSKISKFAQWFHPEENQLPEGESDILSLFPKGGAVKDSSSLFEVQDPPVQEVPQRVNSRNVPRNHGRVLPMPSGPSLEDIEKGLTASASSGQDQSKTKGPSFPGALSLKKLDVKRKGDAMSGVFGEHSPVGKFKFQPVPPTRQYASRSSPVFLTCADIEQSMLAEAGTSFEKNSPNTNQPSRAGGTASRKDGQTADNAASRHLLSLLHKGAGGGKHFPASSWSSHTESLEAPAMALTEGYHDGDNWGQSSFDQGVDGPSTIPSTDNTTLEALFGKAFMSELQSVKAPVSANTFASNSSGNAAATQAVSGVYPVSRQPSGRVNNSPANSNVSKQWPGTIGPLSSMGWTENNVLEANRHGHLTDMPGLQSKVNQYVPSSKDESRPVTSGHGLWGNGVSSHMSDGSLPFDTSVGVKDSFVSNVESTSFLVGDVTDSYVTGKGHLSRAHNLDVDMRTSSKVNGDGKSLPSGNVISGQSKVSEDSTSASSQVISSDEPAIGPSTCFDSSGLPPVFKDDSLAMRMVGDGTTAKLGSAELLAISGEEDTAAVSQVVDSFLLASRKLDRKEMQEDVLTADKIGLGDDAKSGSDRKMADALSDTLGFIGKGKDGSVRVSTISTAGFPEQASAGLTRANSGSMRFKSNVGGLQPTSGFSAFQPVGTALQHQQSIGAVYRSDNPTSLSLQLRQQSSLPVHHHLHQNSSPAPMAMFPQQFLPQQGLPQQQQLLGRTFSNGSSLEFPHVQFGHAPSTAPSRPLPAGHPHFPPSAHLTQPGAYHPMGHMGPTPNHFLPPAQIPQRGPVMSPMAEAIFMQEQALHDPHGLGSKQQGPSLFPLGGHALQSGQGPMFHQPLPHNLRGQQNQLLPGPAPWVVPYSSELMRTASKGHELAGFANGSGGAANSLDRWFGMELSRNVSGIPNPGLMQLSAHGLDAESKMRFG